MCKDYKGEKLIDHLKFLEKKYKISILDKDPKEAMHEKDYLESL